MNRTDWESQVYDSNMNDTAVAVALAIGWHGHWTQEKPVEPGESTIAKMSRKDRKTVGKYVEAMVSQGWLKPLGTGRYNTTIYEMCEVKEPVTGILAHKKKNMSERQLRNLSTTTEFPKKFYRNGNTPLVAEPIHNYEEAEDGLVAETTEVSCGNSPSKLRKLPELVVEPFHTNNTYNNKEQQQVQQQEGPPAPTGPVVPTPSNLKRRILNNGEESLLNRKCLAFNLNQEQKAQAKEILETETLAGMDFHEKVRAALTKIGVDLGDEW